MCNHISQITDLTHIVMGKSKTSWCAFMYFTVQNCMEYNSAGLYFKTTLSERKHKCSGNVDGTTILFLKVCLVAQLCLNFQHMDCSLPGSSCHGDSPDKNTGVGCYALSTGFSRTLSPLYMKKLHLKGEFKNPNFFINPAVTQVAK